MPEDAERDINPQSEGKAVEAPGLDPSEQHHPQMSCKAAAIACLEGWLCDMPKVDSAYRPSGQVPAQSLVAMALGAGLGVLGATLAAVGIGALSVLLLSGFAWLIQRMGKVRGKAFVLIFLGGCTVLLGGYAIMYVAVGVIAARCTTGLGLRMGKMRSPSAAAVFSIVAVAVSMILLHVCQQQFGQWCDPGNFLRGHLRGGWVHWLVRGLEIAGAIVAVCVAGSQASSMVRTGKFCETCELFMAESKLPEVGLGGLRILTAAVNAVEMEAVGYVFDEPPAGNEGKTLLFHCPNCGEGFLETHAQFHASWTKEDGNTETKDASWMTASAALGEKDVERLRAFIVKE
jgi:hypothetical protein